MSATADHYLAADAVEKSELDKANRNATSWRRAFFVAVAFVAGALLLALVLATKDHTEGIIYVQDDAGHLALMGRTGTNVTPSDPAVKNALTQWIGCVRNVPGNDPDLANLCATTVLTMTAKGSVAEDSYRRYLQANNPLALAKQGMIRTVTSVEVNKLTTLTYRVAWKEAERSNGSDARYTDHVGSVTLAQPPRVPNDPTIGTYNPSGLFMQSLDMPWLTGT